MAAVLIYMMLIGDFFTDIAKSPVFGHEVGENSAGGICAEQGGCPLWTVESARVPKSPRRKGGAYWFFGLANPERMGCSKAICKDVSLCSLCNGFQVGFTKDLFLLNNLPNKECAFRTMVKQKKWEILVNTSITYLRISIILHNRSPAVYIYIYIWSRVPCCYPPPPPYGMGPPAPPPRPPGPRSRARSCHLRSHPHPDPLNLHPDTPTWFLAAVRPHLIIPLFHSLILFPPHTNPSTFPNPKVLHGCSWRT